MYGAIAEIGLYHANFQAQMSHKCNNVLYNSKSYEIVVSSIEEKEQCALARCVEDMEVPGSLLQ